MEENLNLENNVVENTTEKKTSGFNKKYIAIIIAVIVLIAAAVFITGNKKVSVNNKPVVYVKENVLYMHHDTKGEIKLADNMGDASGYSNYFFGIGNTFNEDNSVMYFWSDMTAAGTYSLSKVSVLNYDGVKAIDTDVLSYSISKDGSSVAYIKVNGDNLSLYAYDGNGKHIIREKVGINDYYFQLTGDGKHIFYMEEVAEGTINCIKTGIDGSDKTIVAADIDEFAIMASDELVYGRYDDDGKGELYIVNAKGEESFITDSMTGISFFENNEGFVFLQDGVKDIEIWDVVVDDMAEIDKNMVSPVFADYGRDRIEEYLAASDAYVEKQRRDELRKQIDEEKYTSLGLQLYKYDGKKVKKLTENIVDVIVFGKNGEHILIDRADYSDDGYKVLLSELKDLSYIPYAYANYDGADKAYIVSGDVMAPIEYGDIDIQASLYDEDSGKLMFAKDVDYYGAFNPIVVQMEKGVVSKYSYIEDQVNFADFYGDGKFAYVSVGGYLITLVNGNTNKYAENVSYMITNKADGEVYYITDMDSLTYTGTLNVLKDGKTMAIDNGVSYACAIENGEVIYIRNYDEISATCDLYVFNGTEGELIASSVSCVMDIN